MTNESISEIRDATGRFRKGYCPPTAFKKGLVPWNARRHGGYTEEQTKANDKRKEFFSKLNKSRSGEKNVMHNPIIKKKMGDTRKQLYKEGKLFGKEHRENLSWSRLQTILPKRDTKIEILMQDLLRKNNIVFKTHKVIGNIEHKYQCDLFVEPNVVIECDGDYWHKYPEGREIDRIRTKEMVEKGYVVFRFWEHDIKNNLFSCFDKMKSKLSEVCYERR